MLTLIIIMALIAIVGGLIEPIQDALQARRLNASHNAWANSWAKEMDANPEAYPKGVK